MPEYANKLSQLAPSKIRMFHRLAHSYSAPYLLSLGDSEMPTPFAIIQSATEALTKGYTHYEDNQGNLTLRQAICEWETEHFQTTYTPDNVLITAGATHGLSCAIQACLNPNDKVMYFTPSYPLYSQLIQLHQGMGKAIALPSDNYAITQSLLENNYSLNTKLLIINHPHNPTGHILTKEEMQIICTFVLKYKLFLIVDECYLSLQYQDSLLSFSSFQELHSHIIICRSFSKAYAMSGWRIGYLLGSTTAIQNCKLLLQTMLSCVPSFIQQAAITALKEEPFTQHYKQKSLLAYHYLSQVFEIAPIQSGLYYFLPIQAYATSSEEFCLELLKNCGISLIPGTAFEWEGYVRLSIAVEDELLIQALTILVQYLKTRKKR